MNLNKNVPPHVFMIKELKEIYKTQEIELSKLNEIREDIFKQCFINTATWGLDIWEKEYGIKTDKNKSLKQRRSALLAKKRGQGTTTKEVIKQIAQSYASKAKVIENFNDYSFTIELESDKGYPFALDSLYKTIDEIRPAHLGVNYNLISKTDIRLYTGTTTILGETITVYPYMSTELKTIYKLNTALLNNLGAETVTIYPRKEKNNGTKLLQSTN